MSLTLDRVAEARGRVDEACRRAGRAATEVRILAVSKTVPAELVSEALPLVDAVGENRVQEAVAKRPLVGGTRPWHLIGPLQRNKARHALATFDVVESVDRTEIADRLEELLGGGAHGLPVFIEVNIGAEPQKSGVLAGDVLPLARHLLERCPHLRLTGLMAIPPFDPDPGHSRPFFAGLRELAQRLEPEIGVAGLELSMGMSDDFEVAVEEGATWVRLGRALFGERPRV